MRYIDADKHLQKLRERRDTAIIWELNCNDEATKDRAQEAILIFNECISELIDAPTADVRENVKGEWEHGEETARHYLGDACVQIDYAYWRCSACGKVYEQSDKPKYNFCPNCGAQMMRGEA